MTASQKPIGSGFDAASTVSDVINGTDSNRNRHRRVFRHRSGNDASAAFCRC
jgi:hypothetical protein